MDDVLKISSGVNMDAVPLICRRVGVSERLEATWRPPSLASKRPISRQAWVGVALRTQREEEEEEGAAFRSRGLLLRVAERLRADLETEESRPRGFPSKSFEYSARALVAV